jgi:hypothetical protein
MIPRKPTQVELEDIFQTPQLEYKIENERLQMGKYDYAISKLRTEYEWLEDWLEEVESTSHIYSKEEIKERRQKVIHKLDSVYWAIERLKEVNE